VDSATHTLEQVGHYRILRPIGRGGMGSVYLARDTRLGRLVALKFLSADLLGSAEIRHQFDVEARTTASLSHPNVVTLFDVGEHEGRPWVALEYIEGATLSQRMNDDWPSIAESLRIVLAIARAIEAAHAAGIVHRDLKPANVLLGRDGRPRVLDFGIARFTTRRSDPPKPTTEPGTLEILGTPSYMAPEQWSGEDGPATDIWALGLVMHQLLARTHPLKGLDTVRIAAILSSPEPFPAPGDLAATSPELAALVMRCTEKDPEARPTATELVVELEAFEGRQRMVRPTENPFRGLLAFSERHAVHFFGRESEVDAFVERLRERATLIVVGSSGAGKSSFVHAGVVPRLKETSSYHVMALRPQSRPLRALAEAVARWASASGTGPDADTVIDAPKLRSGGHAPADPDELERRIGEHPELLAVVLSELAARSGQRMLLVVDQLEEVVTVAADEAEKRAFVAAICAAGAQSSEPIRVVMTLRDDFLGKIPWGAHAKGAMAGLVLLAPPEPEALREIVRQPLLQTGHAFDDPTLLEEIVASVRGESAALPLLQFAMSLMWTRRDETERLLLREVYRSMGGVGGALAAHAEDVLVSLEPSQVELCRQLLLRLVTDDGTRRPRTRDELLEGLPEEAGALVDRLFAARLLSRQRGEDGLFELAHESLTRVWRRLSRWIEEGHEDVALAADLSLAAERWHRRGRRDDELWTGDALRDATRLVARGRTRLPETALALVRASSDRARRSLRRRRFAMLGLLGAALTVAVGSTLAAVALRERQREATKAALRADQARAQLLEERALASAGAGDVHAARAQLRAALEARDSLSLRDLAAHLEKTPVSSRVVNDFVTYDAKLTPDGRAMVLANQSGTLELVDMVTLERKPLRGHSDQVLGVVTLPDGSLVSASWNGEIFHWKATEGTGRSIAKASSMSGLAAHGSTFAASYDGVVMVFAAPDSARNLSVPTRHPFGLAFGASGAHLYVGGDDGRVHVVDVATGRVLHVGEPGSPVQRIAEDAPHGRWFVTRRDGTLDAYDLTTRALTWRTDAHAADARGLVVSKDGLVWTGGADSRIVAWDVARRAPAAELHTRLAGVTSLSLSDDGGTLVAAGTGGAESWRLDRIPRTPAAPPHDAPVLDLSFSADGTRLVSGSAQSVVVWNVATGKPELSLAREGKRGRDVAFDMEKGRVFATDERGGIAAFSYPTGRPLGTFGSKPSSPFGLSYSSANDLVAVGTSDGTVLVYRASTRALLTEARLHDRDVRGIALGNDGKRLFSASSDGSVREITIAGGRSRVLFSRERGNYGLALSRDDRTLLVTGLDGKAFTVRTDTGEARDLGAFQGRLYHPSISPDGRACAIVSSLGKVILVDISSLAHREIADIHDEANVASFSPDGRLLAVGSDDHTVRLFDIASGRPLREVQASPEETSDAPLDETGMVLSKALAFVPSTRLVAFQNGTVELRAAGRRSLPLRATPNRPLSRVLEGPGKSLILGFADGTLGAWDPGTGALLEHTRLHGRVVTLTRRGASVEGQTELGDGASLDLSHFEVDYCALLGKLRREVPFVWHDGTIRPETSSGPCTAP
jgi:serine/threonine protein kinase/WD40 repeat protein